MDPVFEASQTMVSAVVALIVATAAPVVPVME